VKLWQRNGTLLKTLTGHRAGVNSVVFSPDGNTIASASADNTVKLWQPDGTELLTLEAHRDRIYALAFSVDGQMLASASADNTVKLWHRDGTLLKTLTGHNGAVWGVAFSPDDNTIATASGDNTVKLWQPDGTVLATLDLHNSAVNAIAFNNDGTKLASASEDTTVIVWDVNRVLPLEEILTYSCDWVENYLQNSLNIDEVNATHAGKRESAVLGGAYEFCRKTTESAPWLSPMSNFRKKPFVVLKGRGTVDPDVLLFCDQIATDNR
ncbi:MAG: WD40 repeat domain-containing protein, partial [Cyanobacteria bacterium J06642_3]